MQKKKTVLVPTTRNQNQKFNTKKNNTKNWNKKKRNYYEELKPKIEM